nr:MAG TPA: hypothetical protein [Caudoviricetes sp.]
MEITQKSPTLSVGKLLSVRLVTRNKALKSSFSCTHFIKKGV